MSATNQKFNIYELHIRTWRKHEPHFRWYSSRHSSWHPSWHSSRHSSRHRSSKRALTKHVRSGRRLAIQELFWQPLGHGFRNKSDNGVNYLGALFAQQGVVQCPHIHLQPLQECLIRNRIVVTHKPNQFVWHFDYETSPRCPSFLVS